jgi:hypothetical protein
MRLRLRPLRARWASCALALLVCAAAPAAADHHKSLSDCTSFDQADKPAGDAVELTIHNTCSIPIDCELTWRVVCEPEAKRRRSVHPQDVRVTITEGTSQSTDASAAVCGDGSWQIDGVEWSCQANKD